MAEQVLEQEKSGAKKRHRHHHPGGMITSLLTKKGKPLGFPFLFTIHDNFNSD